ncbi:N-acylneuraminate-9-phosphate synthase [bacterium]|nr:N-acylneuraminate-9-phosphate synthase [bacterium]
MEQLRSKNPLIIAEAGVAHFGELEKAFKLVDMAVDGGANYFKLQHYSTKDLYSYHMVEWRDRMKKKEVSDDFILEVYKYCLKKDIEFVLTPHTESALDVIKKINPPFIKIGSGELGNFPFLDKIKLLDKHIVISTGMHDKEDISRLVENFANYKPGITLLHCTTSYPTPTHSRNLKAITTLKAEYPSIRIGYSDHTDSFTSSIIAVALGAEIIEKHISLDFNIKNAQDWKVSCGPNNFKEYCQVLAESYESISNGALLVQQAENQSMDWAIKRSIAVKDIQIGETLNYSLFTANRCNEGIPISKVNKYIGKVIKSTVQAGDPICESYF